MNIYESCDKVPYTISIQFDAGCFLKYDDMFKRRNYSNRVSHHISIKYVGYEEKLTEKKEFIILEALKELQINKEPLIICGFNVMKSNYSFFNKMLYLEIKNSDYIKNIHIKVIELLHKETDIFMSSDLSSYVPHISCGRFVNGMNLSDMNDKFQTIEIYHWDLVFHSSKKEIKIL